MSIVSTSNIGAPGAPGADGTGVSTSGISTSDIHVPNISYQGAYQLSINESPTNVNQTSVQLNGDAHLQPHHGASFWVA
jgi:hypothetical protein